MLKASFQPHDYYTIGSYDADREKLVPDNKGLTGSRSDLRYDYGKFYASKTFFDSVKNRRILWGWINESDSYTDDIKKGWAGIQFIPRQVYLSITGTQLLQWPIKETENLRQKHVTYSSKKLNRESLFEVSGITAAQEIQVWTMDYFETKASMETSKQGMSNGLKSMRQHSDQTCNLSRRENLKTHTYT